MSYERSDDRERYSDSEEGEEQEYRETDESEESPEDEAVKDLEREEEAERYADEASRELDETEADAKDLADEASRELDSMENEENAEGSMEDDLGHDLDEVRDDLHDRFVNDMDRQLEEPSYKETESEEQDSDTGSSSDMTESSESYEDAGNGMAYALETKGGSGGAEAQTETEQEASEEAEESFQDVNESEGSVEEPEATTDAVNDKFTNRFTRQEHTETDETSPDGTLNHKSTETESDFSKPETSADDDRSDMTNSIESKREGPESVEDSSNHSMETASESEANEDEPQTAEVEDVSEPALDSDIEQAKEPEFQDASDEIQRIVESAESELEDTEVQEADDVLEGEISDEEVLEEEEVLEDLEDFVKKVQDMLDEYMDDEYDYVQDPLTGEMQRVYKILSDYESDEQRLRRKLRNLFAELSEEERDRFKQIVREKGVSEDRSFAEEVESLWSSVVEKAEEARVEEFESSNELEGPLEEVVRLRLLENLSEREIAKKTGLSRNQVRKALRDAEIHHRYYSEGQTFQEIASDLDLTIKILRGVFRKHGWEMRIQRERQKLSDDEIRRLHHEEGMTFFQIAEYSGLDMPTIRKVIGPKKSKTQAEEIGRLYFQEGYSFEMICDILGVSMKTVRRTFEKNNWAYQRTRSTRKQLDPDWVYLLYYVEGFSHSEIGEILGVHSQTIQKLFYDQGWESRERQRTKVKTDIDEERRQYQRNRRMKLKETRVEIFGNKCYACHTENESKKSLHLHRKDGTEHDRNLFRSLKKLKSLNPEEWAPLCDRCHLGAHLLMNVYGYDWAKIESLLESRTKESVKPKGVLDLPDESAPLSKQAKKMDSNLTKKELRKALFGDTCSLCNCDSADVPMILHRKDGQTHDPAMINRKKNLQKLNPEEWALVCHDCHNIAQWALDKLGIGWSKLTKILKQK
ncbi:MAG: hypothetical protein ACFFF9_15740 [Candidatus Thorarchaeota archaeon]